MIRVLLFLLIVLLVAFGAGWMADHPGTVTVDFLGREVVLSTLSGAIALIAAACLLVIAWTLLRFLFSIPSLMTVASAARKRQRGYAALSRGMIAVGSGDADAARRHASDATRYLRHEPMALLLQAQSAQLAGDRKGAEDTFNAMLKHPETRTLALRGLHMEALRRDDRAAALDHAEAAQKLATLPWASHAVIQARAAEGDWDGALKAVERGSGARIIDRPSANRQRAVLLTGMAIDASGRSPDEAIALAREALKLSPDLVPAAALAGRLLAGHGDLKRAARIIEKAYAAEPHPDLADAYVHLRHGDSAGDRLVRAEKLAGVSQHAPETAMMLARAAVETRDLARARRELQPLVDAGRPTRRTCLMMAEIEEAEHGETGALLEWLQRASRAPRDPAWVADGAVFDRWSPVSPISGRLDAMTWTTPMEQLDARDERTILHVPHGEPSPTAVTLPVASASAPVEPIEPGRQPVTA